MTLTAGWISSNDRPDLNEAKGSQMGVHSQREENANAASGTIRPIAAVPQGTSVVDEKSSAINELQNEISALRRELRLLRIANAELERVAVRDSLTPLFNRRYFLSALNERLGRAKRYKTKAAVLFIDVNRMKHINDLFGHSAGDFALVHVAQIVQAHIRTTDVAARIGGDEFAIILEEVDEDQALAKTEQLGDVLSTVQCRFGEETLPVSASIGLTMLRPDDSDDQLIERADADMYARKRAWHENAEAAEAGGKSAAA